MKEATLPRQNRKNQVITDWNAYKSGTASSGKLSYTQVCGCIGCQIRTKENDKSVQSTLQTQGEFAGEIPWWSNITLLEQYTK